MIDSLAQYLMSQRTLTAAEVDARAHATDRYDLTPAERLDNATARTYSAASQH